MTSIPIQSFTRMPNIIFDRYLGELSGSELKVLMALVRQTLGFHRLGVELSMSALCRLSGIKSRDTINRAVRTLSKLGIFTTSGQQGQSNHYQINQTILNQNHDPSEKQSPRKTEAVTTPENGHPPDQKSATTCPKNGQVPVQTLDTFKRKEKEREKEKRKDITPPTRPEKEKLPEEKKRGAGGGLTPDCQKAVDLLIAFGVWEAKARKLVRNRNLTAEDVARAINALKAEIERGVGVRSPAGLLCNRLESGWIPEAPKERSYHVEEIKPARKPQARSPDFMRASFRSADGQRWDFSSFSKVLMEQVAMQLPRETFNAWLRPATFTGCEVSDDQLRSIRLLLENEQAYEWVTKRLVKVMDRMSQMILGYEIEWRFERKGAQIQIVQSI